jgi:hypothetical protein
MNPYTARAVIKDPAAFVGRAVELDDVFGLLAGMQSCSVVGPRRIGKSSLLYHLTHLATYSGHLPDPEPYVFAFVDLQEFAGLEPDDFFFTVVERLCQASRGRLEADPSQYGTLSGFRRFLMEAMDAGLKLVLCCDEFEMLSDNPRFGADFFTYLRGWCSNYNLALVTSSRSNLFDLCHMGNIQTSQFWNIFVERVLGLMPEDEARTLITEPFARAGGTITNEDVAFVLNLAGRHPFFIQIACYYLFKAQSEGVSPDHATVERCFLDEAHRHYTYAWKQLNEAEQTALASLLQAGSTIGSDVFRRLQRSALVVGSPAAPTLVSDGWCRFIQSQMPQAKQAEVSCEKSEGPTLGPIRNRWALLVGINRYIDPAFPLLRFCVNDVLALEQMLKSLGYTVVTLHDDADEEWLLPTRDNVEAELARLCQVAGPEDLLYVHFACHGKLADDQAILITREARAPTLAKRALRLTEVEQQMRESQARWLVLTLDACHTGVESGRDVADPEFIRSAGQVPEGLALIAASTAQQIAQEWHEKEHGVFTYHLLEGFSGKADREGKGFVTVADLKVHILDSLRRWSVEHGGLIQQPTARTTGLDDVILADYRGKEASVMPPVTATTHTLPFDRLSPRDFERLCLWLVEREGYERAEHLGAAGSEQGRDVIAWDGDKLWAFQCKRVQTFPPKSALAEVDKILALPEDQRPVGLVFIVTCDVSANTRQQARDRCADQIECHFWASTELDQKVKRRPDIVKEFFQVAGSGKTSRKV